MPPRDFDVDDFVDASGVVFVLGAGAAAGDFFAGGAAAAPAFGAAAAGAPPALGPSFAAFAALIADFFAFAFAAFFTALATFSLSSNDAVVPVGRLNVRSHTGLPACAMISSRSTCPRAACTLAVFAALLSENELHVFTQYLCKCAMHTSSSPSPYPASRSDAAGFHDCPRRATPRFRSHRWPSESRRNASVSYGSNGHRALRMASAAALTSANDS